MGLIQNKVTVSQPNSHVVVKNAGGLRGLTGETGPQGPQGVPGEAATVTAGTTTTLPAGSDATVQNVGSTSAAIFNFGIPKGDKGDTGESGAAATISVGSTSTLPAGSSATVTNSGTSSAAVFDFGIPKGDKGDTGATGADGYSPTATVTKTGDTATITITDKNGTTTASISDGTTPTVNDGTLTIQKNGTTVQTFSADQASNVTANITVPTQFSDLSGTVSSSQIEDEAITTGSVSGTGTNITLAGTMEGGAIESVELNGDTEQQTYSGKNLYEGSPSFDAFSGISAWEDGGTYNGMPVIKRAAAWSGAYRLIDIVAGVTYTFSAWVKSDGARQAAIYAIGSGATATITPNNKNITTTTSWERVSFTFTCSTSGTVALRFENTSASTTNYTYISGYQLEKNSSMTSFEPYVGGTASPNPDYPQEVQTVTGRQVVTISDGGSESQEYEINLGDIELCKIGTYQDYIYKSGEDWYIHKETWSYTFDGSSDEQWVRSGQSTPTNFIAGMVNLQNFAMIGGDANSGYCNYFDFSTYLDDNKVILSGYQSGGYRFLLYRFPSGSTVTDLASFTTWLGNNHLKMVLVLSTPADTQITNSALIAQLEGLLSATTYSGTTYITVSGDLASPLKVVAEADSKLAPDSVYGAAIKDGAVSVDKIADLKALADALAPYLNS